MSQRDAIIAVHQRYHQPPGAPDYRAVMDVVDKNLAGQVLVVIMTARAAKNLPPAPPAPPVSGPSESL
jgi:hypothetical protein